MGHHLVSRGGTGAAVRAQRVKRRAGCKQPPQLLSVSGRAVLRCEKVQDQAGIKRESIAAAETSARLAEQSAATERTLGRMDRAARSTREAANEWRRAERYKLDL